MTSTDTECAADSFTKAAEGILHSNKVAEALEDREIVLDTPVEATCASLKYLSSWGGKAGESPDSLAEEVATLAEFRAFTVSGDVTEPEPEEPAEPVGPQPFVTLTEGDLSVDLHENFPQIIGYELDSKKADGNKGEVLNKVAINGIEYDAHATEASVSGAKAVWTVSVPAHEGLRFDVTASITDGVIRVELSSLKDADKVVQQVSFPGLGLVTLSAADAGASLVSTQMSVDRNKPGDLFETVASAQTGNRAAWLVVPSTSEMSFGMESNAIADHTSKNARPGNGLNARWVRSVSGSGANKQITVSPGVFTWLGAAVAQHAPGIGYDENPWLEIKPTLDANSDNAIDWQDGATALRDIRPKAAGMEDVKNTVITRIPFNIVSQATHPFLRTLDDTKRIGLATDGQVSRSCLRVMRPRATTLRTLTTPGTTTPVPVDLKSSTCSPRKPRTGAPRLVSTSTRLRLTQRLTTSPRTSSPCRQRLLGVG